MKYLLDITCIRPRYWYMCILLVCYFFFWLTTLSETFYRYKYFVLGGMSLAIFIFGDVVGSLHSEQAISFIIGVFISDIKNSEKAKKLYNSKWTVIILGLVSLSLLALKQVSFIRDLDGTYMWICLQICMKSAMALCVIVLSYQNARRFNNIMLTWIGTVSLEIYLVHYRVKDLLECEYQESFKIVLFIGLTIIGTFLLSKIDDIIIKSLKAQRRMD